MELTQISDLTPSARGEVMSRGSELAAIESDVKQIIDNVRADGDAALREFSREFDDVEMNAIEVTGAATKAVETIHSDVQAAIASTIDRIETFHRHQLRDDWQADFDGRTLGRQFRPIERAGAYVPGGSAAYPSTAMMTVVPARVAGVNTIIAVTPPADPINKVTLAALSLAGVDRIFAAGGAQGIAALAYGTESIPAVDTIVGPGNRWVAAAKAAVQGDVSIDMIAGPSEVLILADETADPEFVASDLIAQAEHDPHASAAAVTPDLELAKRIGDAVRDQLPKRTRGGVAESAFSNESSGIFVAESMDQAVEFTNEYAVEHLGIMTADNESTQGAFLLVSIAQWQRVIIQLDQTTCSRQHRQHGSQADYRLIRSCGRGQCSISINQHSRTLMRQSPRLLSWRDWKRTQRVFSTG